MSGTTDAAVIVVSRGEPVARLSALFDACAAQTVPCRVYVAAPDGDAASIQAAVAGRNVAVVHVSNPGGGRTTGLNLAAKRATEQVLCRLDARTRPPADYVERCLAALADGRNGVVGGVQKPVAGGSTVRARAIARALANPYAVGAPPYRLGARSGPVDTLYLGAFRRDHLLEIGGFDERLDANEDFDLACRFRRAGAIVLLDASMVHEYEARNSIRAVARQYRDFGRAKVTYWRLSGDRPNRRQIAGVVGVMGGVVALMCSRNRLGLAATGASAVAVVDHAAQPECDSPAVRALAVIVEIMLPVVWVGGVLEEVVRTFAMPSKIR